MWPSVAAVGIGAALGALLGLSVVGLAVGLLVAQTSSPRTFSSMLRIGVRFQPASEQPELPWPGQQQRPA